MRPPAFWDHDGALPRLLAPLGSLVAGAAARRVARAGWHAGVPVLCCGNVSVGGTGKTTLALDLGARLARQGRRVAFLTRGYGGRSRGTVRVGARHTADDVGDEALLLAALAPTYVGADRAASARAAIGGGATVLVMDDGLQNPGLVKDLALLVIDGAAGFGNGRVLPAGPLREPVAAGAARCGAAVLIGQDAAGAAAELPPGLPVLAARLRTAAPCLAGRTVLAFAGIGRPAKFFASLAEAGVAVAAGQAFADHHRYRAAELRRLRRRAEALGAVLATTPKDAVRLPPGWRSEVVVAGVELAWQDERQVEALLAGLA